MTESKGIFPWTPKPCAREFFIAKAEDLDETKPLRPNPNLRKPPNPK